MRNTVLMTGIMNLAIGSYVIYLYYKKNEKIVKFGKFPLILGVLFIIYALYGVIMGYD
mgnify:CR=1 FL=1